LLRNSVWAPQSIDHAKSQALAAQQIIRKLFHDSAQPVEDGFAWGQFISDPRRSSQRGIFGSTAAIKALRDSKDNSYAETIRKGLSALPKSPVDDHSYVREGDLAHLFKLTNLAASE
jgi:hypothetical protein